MRKLTICAARLFATASLATLAVAAHAQEAPPEPGSVDAQAAADDEGDESEIVVTGTLIRGIAPIGTNTIGVTREDVVATGASNTNDLLTTIPQLASFNTIPRGTATFGQPIASTNLRGLGASGGTTTLVLLNGHRLVGSGILQTYVDPTIIPPGIIERVEVIPDGGSSIYGSDAIGGVINFITRKRFDGVEVTGRYGWADGYQTTDANLTIGRDWGSGSLSLSYAYAWHNNIQGIERDYVTSDNRANGGTDQRAVTCPLTNIVVGGVPHAMPDLVPGTQNRCDTNDYADIYPRERRHTVFATLEQELSSALTANVTAYWSTRRTLIRTAPLATNGFITDANPFFTPIGTETSQQVTFDYTSVFGLEGVASPARFDSWGITPSLTYDIGSGWQARALANFGHSFNSTTERSINSGAANAALVATDPDEALNPYDLSATNPAVLAAIRDYTNYSEAKQEIAEARLILDGPLFAIGGGDVRLAVGAEYHYENIGARIAFGPSATPKRNAVYASRDVKSVYGELFVPIVGAANAMSGVRALDLTASIRHDSYNDVGGTTNPKVGFNYSPLDGLTFRGNYGTSFHAPSLADTTGAVDRRVTFAPIVFNLPAFANPLDRFRPMLWVSGGNPNLKPEKATTWSLGFDLEPSFVPGLKVSATYFNIDFKDAISVCVACFTGGPGFYADPSNDRFYIIDPTLEQAIAFSGGARADNFESLEAFFATNDPYAIYDLRRYNLSRVKLDGIDFNVAYNRPTSFGSISGSFAGTYTLNRKTSPFGNGVYVDNLKNGTGAFNFVAALGAVVGPVTGRATLTHSGGYPIIGDPTQRRVKAYNPVDLFFSLDLEKMGLGKAVQLTLNIDNLLDDDPPYRNSTTGFANGSTFGRLIAVGIRSRF